LRIPAGRLSTGATLDAGQATSINHPTSRFHLRKLARPPRSPLEKINFENLQNFRTRKTAYLLSTFATHFTTHKPQKHHRHKPLFSKHPQKRQQIRQKPRFPGATAAQKKIHQF
jgi:hypothetical protein